MGKGLFFGIQAFHFDPKRTEKTSQYGIFDNLESEIRI